eukprot:scaffold927_cov67-Skeletonema_dohrnii-CCMP3373.AAC.2
MASAHRLSSSVSSATVKPGQEPDRTHFQSAAASADLGETRRNNFGDASFHYRYCIGARRSVRCGEAE